MKRGEIIESRLQIVGSPLPRSRVIDADVYVGRVDYPNYKQLLTDKMEGCKELPHNDSLVVEHCASADLVTCVRVNRPT